RHRELDLLGTRMEASRYRRLQDFLGRCRDLDRRLAARRPRAEHWQGRLDLAAQALTAASRRRLRDLAHRLERAASALGPLNPSAVLARGYGIVRDDRGRVVRDAAQLVPGTTVALKLHRGEATARVVSTEPEKP
ncbi:MAG: hypothetical protein JNM82_13385, partial [Rhodocyclaceae bacterium]|nr:hypothetical protein [Rhodocyclaceae bacterium]